MARIRTIKPEFWQSESLAQCSPHARLLAIALLQLCDKNGVFLNVPMQVHAHAFPWESEVNIQALLGELEGVGYVNLYRVDGKRYGFIPGFCTHQRIQGKEAQSAGHYPLPNQADTEGKQRGVPGEYSGDSRGDTGKGKEREKEREKENPLVDSDEPTDTQAKAKSAKNDTPPEFETLWSEYPQREGPNPKRDALKAYRARMREGVSPDDLIAGVLRYKSWLMRKGKVGTEFVQRASTFLGPGENWKQSFEAGGGGLTRPPEADRDAWLRLAKQAGVENRIAGKTHDQVWDMICESLAQQEVA